MSKPYLDPISPGEILLEEFLIPMNLSENDLAIGLALEPSLVHQIITGEQRITVDTAENLGQFFGMSTRFWINLQHQYDLEVAHDSTVRQNLALGESRPAAAEPRRTRPQ